MWALESPRRSVHALSHHHLIGQPILMAMAEKWPKTGYGDRLNGGGYSVTKVKSLWIAE